MKPRPLPKGACQPAAPAQPKVEVVYQCGRTQNSKVFKGQDCPKCRREHRQAHPKAGQLRPRLPADSTILMDYDAATQTWAGALEVNGVGRFEGSGPALFALLQHLDKQCRAAVASARESPPAAPQSN
jgi:hypothetical protein